MGTREKEVVMAQEMRKYLDGLFMTYIHQIMHVYKPL